MIGKHLNRETLERFASRALSRDELLETGWHLFLCARCRELLEREEPAGYELFERMFSGNRLDIAVEEYAGVLPRVAESLRELGRQLEQQRVRAPGLFEELRHHPHRRRLWMVEHLARFQTYGLAEHLLTRCREDWSEDPVWSEELSELALSVIEHLDPQLHGRALLNDLKAEAWSYIANCRRIRSDLWSVAEAFEIAEEFRGRGTGDSVEEAALLDLKASYLRDQRRFPEADAALDRVITLYREAKDQHLEGRALIKRAKLRRDSGDLAGAIVHLREAQDLIDGEREPHLVFFLKKNLALYLGEAERAEEARELLPEVRELARRVGSRLERLRFQWVEGLIFRQLGQLPLAESSLTQARDGFIEAGIGYDAALVSLDLAVLYLEAERIAEARDLAETMLPLFAARDVHREALAALLVFRRAAEQERATVGLVRQIRAYLHRARHNPALRFEPELHPATGA